MSDYATLTDAEINRRISDLLGYSVKKIDNPTEMTFRDGLHQYALVVPRGLPAHVGKPSGTEDGARMGIPQWSTDIKAAMWLLNGRNSFILWKNTYTVDDEEITEYSLGIEGSAERHYRASLPRAICEAWLAWKEATHA